MPTLVNVNCENCNKPYKITLKRFNEGNKRNWKFYCSPMCHSQAKTKAKTVKCTNCSKFFIKELAQMRSKNNFCSQSCAAKYNNQHRLTKRKASGKISSLRTRTIKKIKKNICLNPNCGKLVFKKYCSVACQQHHQKPSKSEYKKRVIEGITKFYNNIGRIPLKRELNHLHRPARMIFGTWNNAIKAAGYKSNPVLFAYKHRALDGHKCDSFAEMIIDNWLYENNIPHEIHPTYPGANNYQADFKIGPFWVEFFGLAGDLEKYDRNIKKKPQLVKENKMLLVDINPTDLFPKSKLNFKLEFFKLRPEIYEYQTSATRNTERNE